MAYIDICSDCTYKAACKAEKVNCSALVELYKIQDKMSKEVREEITRELARKLGIRDAEPNDKLRDLAEAIICKYREFQFIKAFDIRVGYVSSYEKKTGEKITYADCRKVPVVYQAYLPFDFIITFYEYSTEYMSENQKKILMRHELQHIRFNKGQLSIRPHDIEDFKDILEQYGNDWNKIGNEVSDILSEGDEYL